MPRVTAKYAAASELMMRQPNKEYTENARISHIIENVKNFVRLSLADTSRSTFPLQASYTIGTIGRITIMTKQIRIDESGSRTGPRPIGDATEKIIPTYRFMRGAGVSREITLDIVTLLPSRSRVSSWYFTIDTE